MRRSVIAIFIDGASSRLRSFIREREFDNKLAFYFLQLSKGRLNFIPFDSKEGLKKASFAVISDEKSEKKNKKWLKLASCFASKFNVLATVAHTCEHRCEFKIKLVKITQSQYPLAIEVVLETEDIFVTETLDSLFYEIG